MHKSLKTCIKEGGGGYGWEGKIMLQEKFKNARGKKNYARKREEKGYNCALMQCFFILDLQKSNYINLDFSINEQKYWNISIVNFKCILKVTQYCKIVGWNKNT